MTEIAQLFETALKSNRAGLLRKAAKETVVRMPEGTTLRDLLESEAGEAIRELTLRELAEALSARSERYGHLRPAPDDPGEQVWPESREERIYKQILEALGEQPLTVGQLSRRVELDTDELRGYLTWMKRMGKIQSSGRARATRYHVSR